MPPRYGREAGRRKEPKFACEDEVIPVMEIGSCDWLPKGQRGVVYPPSQRYPTSFLPLTAGAGFGEGASLLAGSGGVAQGKCRLAIGQSRSGGRGQACFPTHPLSPLSGFVPVARERWRRPEVSSLVWFGPLSLRSSRCRWVSGVFLPPSLPPSLKGAGLAAEPFPSAVL